MRQIRARIREKRGVDYTEDEIRELANVKLEKFLDPGGVRSDLLEQYRRRARQRSTPPQLRVRGHDALRVEPRLLRSIRKMLQPILKLFFNPNPLIEALHIQSKLNDSFPHSEALYYELIHNLVLETTRLGIEVKNLKMRVESMSSRLDFDERRARALEGVVQYRPARCRRSSRRRGPASAGEPRSGGQRRSARTADAGARRRRRGRRRPGSSAARQAAGGERRRRPDGPDDQAGAASRRTLRAGRTRQRRRPARIVKLAVVVQRYGADINGGAELHARYIAEHLSRHAEVEVVTTCARDYITWRNELPAGRRAGQRRPRAPLSGRARAQSARVRPPVATRVRPGALDGRRARVARQRRPGEPGAGRLRRAAGGDVRLLPLLQLPLLPRVSWCPRACPAKAILVPTAERDPAIGLRCSGRFSAAFARSCTTRRKSAR